MAHKISARDKQSETEERQEKKHELVRKAIPNIASAIKTVVGLSNNENFKAECFVLVKGKDENEFYKALKKILWNIATSKLNVKQCGDGESEIVPGVNVSVGEAKEKTIIEAVQNDEPYSGTHRAEDYFDDLAAGDISFYDDSSSQENCPFDHEAKDVADPDTCGRSLLMSEVQELREQRSSAIVQERPCFVEQVERCTPLPTTAVMPDVTSPKAKLRCYESALITNRKATSSKDGIEDLTQDVFWMENNKTPSQQTLKDIHTLDCYAEEQANDAEPVCRLQSTFQGITDDDDDDHDTFRGCAKKSHSFISEQIYHE